MEREDIVAAVVSAADGKITGRVRLQKVIYLLNQRDFPRLVDELVPGFAAQGDDIVV